MTGTRLETGGLVDRANKRRFLFDGRWYEGFAGDTLGSSLLANGVRVVGRSFKYHRPRGIWGAWVDEPNALMDVSLRHRHIPNCQATTTYLEDRMEARAVNAWPTARLDVKRVLDLGHRWFGAGFYYKTFMWPDWHLFEPMIRRMAGLGTVSPQAFDDYLSDQVNETCDLLVVGAGPAGLTAARTAAENGAKVLIVDDHDRIGGSAYRLGNIDGVDAMTWVDLQHEALRGAGCRVLARTTAIGAYDHGLIACVENTGFAAPPRFWRIRPARTILATGALDRPLSFPGNDRPGIMSLEAAWEYLARYGVLVGKKLCVMAAHNAADPAIRALENAGAQITQIDPGQGAVRSFGTRGVSGLQQGNRRHAVDAVCISGGLTPLVHLWRHAGGKLDWNETAQAFVPGTGPQTLAVVGAANGCFDLATALEDARAGALGKPRPSHRNTFAVQALPPDPAAKGRQWIDFQHDVTLKDIAQAAQENYRSVEHLKRYTTLGMAPDQGKTSNMAGLSAMAALTGRTIPEVGTTTFRPPYTPVPVTTYRGHRSKSLYHPLKRLPLENQHRTANAAFGEYGGWLRPAWYGDGDQRNHIAQEVKTARATAGLFDASPLGKIDVMGPDAAAFLNFVYYNTIASLKPGGIRYGFMLTESGVILDDGVVTRIAPEHFVVSCSSSHVTSVHRLLQLWRQDGNDPDRIFIHDTTAHWITLTVTGPQARTVVAALGTSVELSAPEFPHMQFREARFHDSPLRIARVSFTGDLSFELSVAASEADRLWQVLYAQLNRQNGGLLGLEALSIMRAEKGYIIAGRDTDGLSMPQDLGFAGPRDNKKAASVGDRSLHSHMATDHNRRQLVGLSVPEGSPALPTGAHLTEATVAAGSIGIVTSSYDSPTLGYPIALALVNRGVARIGSEVSVYHLGETRTARVCPPCFLDPDGERLHA